MQEELGKSDLNDNSSYDFLYVDYDRVCSYLVQQDDVHLESVAKTTANTDTTNKQGEVSIPSVAKGSINNKTAKTDSMTENYNAYWINVNKFMTYHHNAFNKEREPNTVVMVKGALSIISTNEIVEAMTNKDVTSFLLKSVPNKDAGSIKAGFGIVSSMLRGVFASINENGVTYSLSIKEDYLKESARELNLRHGICIGNNWCCLGIIDNITDTIESDVSIFGSDKSFENATRLVLNMQRTIMGRPASSSNFVPILIFREIS